MRNVRLLPSHHDAYLLSAVHFSSEGFVWLRVPVSLQRPVQWTTAAATAHATIQWRGSAAAAPSASICSRTARPAKVKATPFAPHLLKWFSRLPGTLERLPPPGAPREDQVVYPVPTFCNHWIFLRIDDIIDIVRRHQSYTSFLLFNCLSSVTFRDATYYLHSFFPSSRSVWQAEHPQLKQPPYRSNVFLLFYMSNKIDLGAIENYIWKKKKKKKTKED